MRGVLPYPLIHIYICIYMYMKTGSVQWSSQFNGDSEKSNIFVSQYFSTPPVHTARDKPHQLDPPWLTLFWPSSLRRRIDALAEDDDLLDEVLKEIAAALLHADVNVRYVSELRTDLRPECGRSSLDHWSRATWVVVDTCSEHVCVVYRGKVSRVNTSFESWESSASPGRLARTALNQPVPLVCPSTETQMCFFLVARGLEGCGLR